MRNISPYDNNDNIKYGPLFVLNVNHIHFYNRLHLAVVWIK